MVGLSLVAMLYIFVGGLGFLVNMMATAFLVSRPEKPLMPLTIYGLSDTLSGALTGIALLCDGGLYFANPIYNNSCSRYFLIYTLLAFPIVTGNFSTFGVATEHHQVIAAAPSQPVNFRHTFSLVWTVASWFIAIAFIIVLWGHTMVFSVKEVHKNIFSWENEEIRHNRGLLENLWEHNSQQDWSSDYRENVIIGLIYGIVGGNISHNTLKHFRGGTQNEQFQPINQKGIKELHAALGITNEDLQRVFGEKLNENSQNVYQTNNTSLHAIGNLTENNSDTDSLLALTSTHLKAFKPSSTDIIKNLTNTSSKHSSNKSHIKNVTNDDLPAQVPQSNSTDISPTTILHFNLRDTDTLDKLDVKQPNKPELSSPTHVTETLSNANIFNIFNTQGDSQLITNPVTEINTVPEVNEEKFPQVFNDEISSPITRPDVHESVTTITQTYTQAPGEGHNFGSDTTKDEKLSLTTVALSTEVTSEITSQQGMQFQPSTAFYNEVTKTNSGITTESNITTDGLQVTEVMESTKLPDKIETEFSTKNLSIHSNITLSTLPVASTEEDRSTNPPSTTNFTSRACQMQPQTNFLSTFMMVLFMLAFAVPLLVSAGLYTHTACVLYHQNPSQSTDFADAGWLHAKRATCQMVVILLANFGCWTPFMVERLLYAWGVVNNHNSVVPSLLFSLGHSYSLLRGVFYISDRAAGRTRISAIPTITICNSGCISSVIPMDEAAINSSQQSDLYEENTQIQGNVSSSALPLTQDTISNAGNASSLSSHESTTPPLSSNFNPLPNMVSNTSTTSNKRNR
ncbi:uncharacterized protein [Panulirus ornatus]|uniref:uncharacterized protein n=1 Tax=Panulirus ornatus TaxID=150431 RepID=UPI003A88CB75